MAVLTSAQRKKMPGSEFGEPESKGFPMNDKTHDRMAISGASRSYNAGNISKSTEERIQAEARKKLGNGATGGNTEPVQKEQVRGGQGSPMRKRQLKPVPSMEQDTDGSTKKPAGSPMRFRGR